MNGFLDQRERRTHVLPWGYAHFMRSALDRHQLSERSTEDSMESAAFVTDALLDSATSHSEDTSASPCLRLLKSKGCFDHLHAPGNEYLAVSFL